MLFAEEQRHIKLIYKLEYEKKQEANINFYFLMLERGQNRVAYNLSSNSKIPC